MALHGRTTPSQLQHSLRQPSWKPGFCIPLMLEIYSLLASGAAKLSFRSMVDSALAKGVLAGVPNQKPHVSKRFFENFQASPL